MMRIEVKDDLRDEFECNNQDGLFNCSGEGRFSGETSKPNQKQKQKLRALPCTPASMTSMSSSEREKQGINRQYIYDRIYGNSYVPRDRRKAFIRRSDEKSLGGESVSVDDEQSSADDPASVLNRPPHRWCWVPTCVHWCPGFMEQNACCAFMGRIGFHGYFKNHHHARRRIFTVALVFNGIAFCFLVVSCLAFSLNSRVLTRCSFLRGTITAAGGDGNVYAFLNIGFRGVALDDPHLIAGGSKVSTFNNFCEDSQKNSSTPIEGLLYDGLCGSCRSKSGQFVLSCLINIIIILRNMISDVTRMYPKYDLNCPNFAGSLMSTMSVILGLWTILIYQDACFTNIRHMLPEEDGALSYVTFTWSNGPGLNCLISATFLRFVDAIVNFTVPTPSITRSLAQQELYELEFGHTPVMGGGEFKHLEHTANINDGRQTFSQVGSDDDCESLSDEFQQDRLEVHS